MKFKPATEKYVFDENILIKHYVGHLTIPIASWIKEVLWDAGKWKASSNVLSYEEFIDPDFVNNLHIHFREKFPKNPDHFLQFILEDSERTTNFLALCLQNYANSSQSRKLEEILSVGGSGYAVIFTSPETSPYQRGVADIVERVPEVIQKSAEEVFQAQQLIKEAWLSCYSRNPDYSKTVSKCVDALEGLLKEKYFPGEQKPTLGKFVKDLAIAPGKLSYNGNTIVNPKNLLTDLASEFISIRGHHTSGTGRQPTKSEAEFVLHYTIFVFSIHK